MRGSDFLLIIIALIFPPLAVFMITGCGCDLLINILLTCLGYIPGHIHAFWLIYKKVQAEKLYGVGGYSYIGSGRFNRGGPVAPVAPVGPAAGAGYGATTY